VEEEMGERGPNSYLAKPPWRRALIIFAGPFANLLAAIAIFAVIYMVGVPTEATTEVEEVIPGSLATEVGLVPGDDVVSVDGETVGRWEDFQEYLDEKSPGDEVTIGVERAEGQEEYTGTLGADPENAERAIVGVSPVVLYTSYGPLEALWLGTERTAQVIGLMGWFVGELVVGNISFYDSVSSPIGVVGGSSDLISRGAEASRGAEVFAQLLAFISINLAVFNLLPMLPLDGGHLFFIAAEKVMGRPVRPETVARIMAIGVALILMLFVFATYADLSKIVTGQPFIPEQGP
jgi:regulator of sigma E protease